MSRLDENEGLDVLGNPRDRAEPLLNDGEDLDTSGHAVEDANEPAMVAGADKDVKDRPLTVAKPICLSQFL